MTETSDTGPDLPEPSPSDEQRLAGAMLSALAGAATPADTDVDHRLTRASVSMRLFGRGETISIGKYQVERRIGAGGMGEVYLCEDQALDRKVAIKWVLGRSSATAQERLRREARALARLNHRNVV
ncbi:MAG: protein kinase, partial [Myxococcales bacterium]|nr:protein kinase [Myxococcales bacterium]